MSLAARVGRAIAWGQAGRVTETVCYFFFYLYLARVLEPAGYGQFATGLGLASACGFLAMLGLGPETLGRFLPEISAAGGPGGVRRALAALVGVRLIAIAAVAGAVFAFRSAIAARLHFSAAAAVFSLVLAVFAARALLDLFTYFTASLLDLRRVAAAKLIVAVLTPGAFLLLAAWVGAGVRAAWLATAAGSCAGILILLAPFLPARGPSPAPAAASGSIPLRRILAFGMFAWATNIFLYVLGDNTDVLLLGWLVGSPAEVGAYAAASKIAFSLMNLLLGWSALVCVASLSEAWQREGDAKVSQLLEAQWKLGVFCLVGPLLLVARYARDIVLLLYSPSYASGAAVLRIFCLLLACSAALGFSLGISALCATSRQRRACWLVGAAAAFNLLTEIPFVRLAGIRGAAWSTGLSFIVLAIASAVAARQWIRWQAPGEFALKIFAAALLALVPTIWIPAASVRMLAAGASAWAASFVAALVWLRPLGERERSWIERLSPLLGRMAGWLVPPGALMRQEPAPGVPSCPE
jgi:O-antigen/teichoic acid export membrane protein